MRNFNPFAVMPRLPLYEAVDGAAGGGADADGGAESTEAGEAGESATDGDDDAGADAGDVEGRQGRETTGEDDDDALLFGTDDDDAQDDRPLDQQHKALKTAHNKLKRRFAKNLPIVKALREAGVKDVQDFIRKSRSFDALLERAGGDVNRLIKLIQRDVEGDDDDQGGRRDRTDKDRDGQPRGKAKPNDDDSFLDTSDEDLGKMWDTSTESGKFFVRLTRMLRDTRRELKEARGRVDQLEGGIRQKDETSLKKEWVDVIEAGAKKITNEGHRKAYRNLMAAGYREGGRKFDPRALSTSIMKDLGIAPTTQRIVHGAQQQRMATTNQQRPNQQMSGRNASAAPARGKRETVADVTRRIRAS